jgi:hypothetical protein
MSTGPQFPNSISSWAIWIVIVVAIVAVIYVMLQVTGIAVPSWVLTLLWICLAAVIAVAVIKFLSRLGNNP